MEKYKNFLSFDKIFEIVVWEIRKFGKINQQFESAFTAINLDSDWGKHDNHLYNIPAKLMDKNS